MPSSSSTFIAHVREKDGRIQSLEDHLTQTAELARLFASAVGLPLCGRLLGLCHDLGKYSSCFQNYIREVTGLEGEAARITAREKQGKIDHATVGAQLIWESLAHQGTAARILAQILSVAVMSHHSRSGMRDFISLKGKSPFLDRLGWEESATHFKESVATASSAILDEIRDLLQSGCLFEEFNPLARRIKDTTSKDVVRPFHFSLLSRFLFSCLLDADRIDTADFENQKAAEFRRIGTTPDWSSLTRKLEAHLDEFQSDSEINRIRQGISDECRSAASRPERLLTLGVPTGGGKTLASLRFALHRAKGGSPHSVERIIYVIPYTSIIDQNAREVRKILGDDVVLEHHSNLAPENDQWSSRVLSENWDAPIVFTTSVQLLNALFAKGTSSARRMHQLANSILIFDEIQTLPVKTIHAFNNAINFLTLHTNSTVLLCTATMPLLGSVNPALGALSITPDCEIISDKRRLFTQLKRTEIIDQRRYPAWTHPQIATFALELVREHRTLLVVCNTKDSAQDLFELLRRQPEEQEVVHLSTSMCPTHRREVIDNLRSGLAADSTRSVICISTQLIEAGVDLDFGCVVRSLAGMDSVIQAGGRCNRHGSRPTGYVYVMNFGEEQLGKALADISNAQQDTLRVLDEFLSESASLDGDLLSEAVMNRFYTYNFHKRATEMQYPLRAGSGNPPLEKDASMLDLLSKNLASLETLERTNSSLLLSLPLQQAFSTAAQAFCVIDAPTRGIIVPYKDGSKLIGDLSAAFNNEDHPLKDQVGLLKLAQQYTVNVFPHVIKRLDRQGALREVQPGSEIYYLDERYYHPQLGVTLEALSEQNYLEVAS